ncbi:unnamed protein product, partial [Ectocarpus sp. 4 AP-2014]
MTHTLPRLFPCVQQPPICFEHFATSTPLEKEQTSSQTREVDNGAALVPLRRPSNCPHSLATPPLWFTSRGGLTSIPAAMSAAGAALLRGVPFFRCCLPFH